MTGSTPELVQARPVIVAVGSDASDRVVPDAIALRLYADVEHHVVAADVHLTEDAAAEIFSDLARVLASTIAYGDELGHLLDVAIEEARRAS